MSQTLLSPEPDVMTPPNPEPQPDPHPLPPPRLRKPNRDQEFQRPCTLEELLPQEHDARTVWALVLSWDLSRFYDTIRARGEAPGRAATDPCLLIALWLYATIRGVASARELDRLCRESDPYRWLCGGVSINYHTLSDFRNDHEAALDDLLTQMLAVLIRGKAVTVQRISQDGTRVRASAGANSFQKKETLQQALQKARAHLAIIGRQAERLGETTPRQRAARVPHVSVWSGLRMR